VRTFDDIPADKHKEIAIKVIKFALKSYYKLAEDMYPATGAVKTETMSNLHPGDIFCLKIDIDRAIQQLPLNLRKIIIMAFIVGWPVSKICSALGFKFRVDFTVP
jgi:DNA-directed RNA polymerase specialized sigma24 family protein